MIHSSVNYIESHMNAERKTGKNRKKNKTTKRNTTQAEVTTPEDSYTSTHSTLTASIR